MWVLKMKEWMYFMESGIEFMIVVVLCVFDNYYWNYFYLIILIKIMVFLIIVKYLFYNENIYVY